MSLERAIREATQPLWREIEHLRNEQARRNLDEIEMGNRGWISGAWQKDPLRLGYSAAIRFNVSETNLSAGANILAFGTVPAGEIWVIESFCARYVGTVSGVQLRAIVDDAGADRYINALDNLTTGLFYQFLQAPITLEEGEILELHVTNATAGDDVLGSAIGRRIDIDQ